MSHAAHPLKAVLFDMDGVLCDSESMLASAACRLFRERYGATVHPEEFTPFVGTGDVRYLGGVAEKHRVSIRLPEDKAELYRLYLDMVPGRLQPIRGAMDFVGECRQRGLKIAVATSADRIKLEGSLAAIGLPPPRFDAIVTGSDITHAKPNPEIFLTAASKLGLPPSQCLVIEDSPHGIAAARSAGCPCVALATTFAGSVMEGTGPDLVLAHLEEGPAIWERWSV